MKSLIYLVVVLTASASGLDIHCTFSVTTWNTLGTVYSCHANITRISEDSTVDSITGTHLSGRNNEDVELIDFTQEIIASDCSALTFVPQGLTDFFPNLRGFLTANCNIRTLTGYELDGYPNIELFSIVRDGIQRIPERLFQFTPKLRGINFGVNEIQHIDENAFDHLDDLVTLRFYNAGCVNRQVFDNRSQVLNFIEEIKRNCTWIDEPATTTTTTTTTEASSCPSGNHDERICKLEDISERHDEVNKAQNVRLDSHEDEILQLRKEVEYLHEMLVEISSRPCSC